MNARARTLALMRSLGFYASWPMYADRLTLGSGLIQIASDEIAARALTFASGARPTHDTSDPARPCAMFAGAEGGKDGGGLLTGLGGATFFLVSKDDAYSAGYQFLCLYGPDGGAGSATVSAFAYLRLITSRLDQYSEYNATPSPNYYVGGAAHSTAWGVDCLRVKFSDGTAGLKPVRTDGANHADTHAASADLTGVTFSSYPFLLGTYDTGFGGTAYPYHGKIAHVAIGPYLSDADADRVQQALKAEWGTP